MRAGLAGSVVSVAVEWAGWRSAARRVTVGILSSIYLSPASVPFINSTLGFIKVPEEHAIPMSGFLMGVCGVIVIEVVLNAFRLWSKQKAGRQRIVQVPVDPTKPIKELPAPQWQIDGASD